MQHAQSYAEWESLAFKLDAILGNDLWRQNPASRAYDHRLIQHRLNSLTVAREEDDMETLTGLLRGGLLRNLGSIGSTNLFNRAYSGTKYLTEDYINEVIECLDYVDESDFQNGFKKADFFHDIFQSYGRTALILHGGSLFGFCHLGTVKALYDNELLPNIICGTTAGAIIAALVCSCPPVALPKLFEQVVEDLPPLTEEYKNLKFGSVVEGVLKSLYPPEIILLEEYVRNRLGDLTFEEAYIKSQRVLNITVSPKSDTNKFAATEVPLLLNYLSTPNVVISSAIRCSVGTGILPGKTVLLEKSMSGEIRPYGRNNFSFLPANDNISLGQKNSPYKHLSELFNVNNFLVSLARPYFAPVLLSDFKRRGHRGLGGKLLKLFRLEVQHRTEILSHIGLIPRGIQRMLVDETIPGGFQVTIVPELASFSKDFARLFDSHDINSKARHWIRLGERGVWPLIAIIWARCAVEFVLEELFNRKRNAKFAT